MRRRIHQSKRGRGGRSESAWGLWAGGRRRGAPSWELERLKSGPAIIERRLGWSATGPNRHRALLLGRDSVKGAREVPDEEWMSFMALIAKACGVADRLQDPRARVFRVGLCEMGRGAMEDIDADQLSGGENAVLSVDGALNWEAFEAWIEAAELEEGLGEAPGARQGGRL